MRCSIQWCWKCWKWAYAFGGDDDWRRWWWWRTKEAAKNGITCLNENIITLWNWVTCHLLLHYSFCDKITDNSKLISLLSIVFSNLTEWCHPKKNGELFGTWNQTRESGHDKGNGCNVTQNMINQLSTDSTGRSCISRPVGHLRQNKYRRLGRYRWRIAFGWWICRPNTLTNQVCNSLH